MKVSTQELLFDELVAVFVKEVEGLLCNSNNVSSVLVIFLSVSYMWNIWLAICDWVGKTGFCRMDIGDVFHTASAMGLDFYDIIGMLTFL